MSYKMLLRLTGLLPNGKLINFNDAKNINYISLGNKDSYIIKNWYYNNNYWIGTHKIIFKWNKKRLLVVLLNCK